MQISEGSKVSKWTISRNGPGKDHKCVDRHIWKHVNEGPKVCMWTRLQTYQGRIEKPLMDVSGNASVKD